MPLYGNRLWYIHVVAEETEEEKALRGRESARDAEENEMQRRGERAQTSAREYEKKHGPAAAAYLHDA